MLAKLYYARIFVGIVVPKPFQRPGNGGNEGKCCIGRAGCESAGFKTNAMKYFFDTEFIEGWRKPIKWLPTIGNFNKPYHSIQLISIGIVCEDGREYYAVSKDFDWNWGWNKYQIENGKKVYWLRDNVLRKLQVWGIHGDKRNTGINAVQKHGKSNKRIAQDIIDFVNNEEVQMRRYPNCTVLTKEAQSNIRRGYLTPEFYAYYADYDWVVFCSLFGTMMDLPKGFPMYCRDLKQVLDAVCEEDKGWEGTANLFKIRLELVKGMKGYPKQTNEHNALDDARWNKQLFEFLKTV